MKRLLKILRVVISVGFLAVITTAVIGAPLWLTAVAEWSLEIQFVPAVLTFALGIFVAWMIITLILGRVYCSTVCPLGTLQDIAARLRRGRIYRFSEPHTKTLVFFLILALLSWLLDIHVVLQLLDPASAYYTIVEGVMNPTLAVTAMGLGMFVVVVVMAWMGGRLYCNTVCPVGAVLGMVSRISVFHIAIDPDKCIRCRRCVDVCKAQCIEIDTCVVDNSRCVVCLNCLQDCPNDAIHYTADRKKLATPMFQPINPKRKIAVNNNIKYETISRPSAAYPRQGDSQKRPHGDRDA